jgi:hypothetical protein
MLWVTLKCRLGRKRCELKGANLAGWRVIVESGRALAEQMMEGLVLACASDRTAPASARRRLVRAVRNMVKRASNSRTAIEEGETQSEGWQPHQSTMLPAILRVGQRA